MPTLYDLILNSLLNSRAENGQVRRWMLDLGRDCGHRCAAPLHLSTSQVDIDCLIGGKKYFGYLDAQ